MISAMAPNGCTGPDMERMISLYGTPLLRMCFLYLKDMHLAEDAAQDAFLKIYKNYGKFKGESDEKTWVMRIAINVCKNYLRSSWWKRVDESVVLEGIPCEDAEDSDTTLLLEIMKLPSRYKEVILLYYYQDMKIREIALSLQVPEATVSTRLKRAREILKTKLKGWYYDE